MTYNRQMALQAHRTNIMRNRIDPPQIDFDIPGKARGIGHHLMIVTAMVAGICLMGAIIAIGTLMLFPPVVNLVAKVVG